MHPTLSLPWLGIEVPWHPVVLWVTSILAVTCGPFWIQRLEGLDATRVRRAQLTVAVIPVIGARLHFLLNNPYYFSRHPLHAFLPWGGAMHMGGALIGMLVGVPLVARYYRLPMTKLGDGLIPIIGLSVAAARVGCILAGCCYGTRCDLPWSITYPPGSFAFTLQQQAGAIPADAIRSLPVHPAPVYFLLAGLLTTVVALLVNRHKRYDGQVVWVGMIVLFGATAALEAFRAPENHRVFWGPLAQLTWTEIAMTVVGLVGLAVSEVRVRLAAGAVRARAQTALLGADS
jgi:phosphatidylglycerol---prolipoprotein diacylglyceryl transferase